MSDKQYYHATPMENYESIFESGTLEPSFDGYVHLTTNPDRALMFMRVRGIDSVSLFLADPYFLDESKIEPFEDGSLSGDECYIHDGELRGVILVDHYWFNFNPN
jgi:hypothetical protein